MRRIKSDFELLFNLVQHYRQRTITCTLESSNFSYKVCVHCLMLTYLFNFCIYVRVLNSLLPGNKLNLNYENFKFWRKMYDYYQIFYFKRTLELVMVFTYTVGDSRCCFFPGCTVPDPCVRTGCTLAWHHAADHPSCIRNRSFKGESVLLICLYGYLVSLLSFWWYSS